MILRGWYYWRAELMNHLYQEGQTIEKIALQTGLSPRRVKYILTELRKQKREEIISIPTISR